MIFKRKGEVDGEVIAVAVAVVQHHLKVKGIKEGISILTPSQIQELPAIPSSSWISIWRYEAAQQLYRRGGVRSW